MVPSRPPPAMSRSALTETEAPLVYGPAPTPTYFDLAWLAVVPAVAIVLPTMIWLAPPVARNVMPKPAWHVFPSLTTLIVPEPVEQLRYFIALGTPLVILAFCLLFRWQSDRRSWTRGRWCDPAVIAVQVSLLAGLSYCWADQAGRRPWFSTVNLILGLVFAGALFALLRHGLILRRPGRTWSVVAVITAGVLTLVWLLPALYSDASITHASGVLRYHVQFTMDELLTVANGRAPIVNYASQYTKVLPYLVAPVVAVVGTSVTTVTGIMWALSVVSMAAIYMTLKTVTGNAIAALFLYAPFLAVSNYTLVREGPERIVLATLYGVVPLRVAGPFVVASLLALELRRPRRWARVGLVAFAVLAAVNNLEYGLACAGAVLAGLFCGQGAGPWSWARSKVLLAEAVAGVGAGAVTVCVLTLATTRSLPRPEYISHFNRAFAIEGFGLVPMPTFGLHVLFFLTFCAAFVVAVVASATGSEVAGRSPVLVGALGYSGVLGLGAYSYWVGRSHQDALFAVFPTWGFTVCLFAWMIIREGGRLDGRNLRTVVIPAMLLLTCFGVMATVIVQVPSPVAQWGRMTSGSISSGDPAPSSIVCLTSPQPTKPCPIAPDSFRHESAVRFVEANTTRGERVMVLTGLGHLIALESGVVNVSPYSHPDAIAFTEQMDFVFKSFARTGATKIFLGLSYPEIAGILRQRGFVPGPYDKTSGLTEWVASEA